MRYSVLIGCRMMILLMSLNSFQSSSLKNTLVTNATSKNTQKAARSSLSVLVLDERLELGAARDGEVERLGGEEGLEVEEVEVVLVDEVGNELVGETIQGRHLWQ